MNQDMDRNIFYVNIFTYSQEVYYIEALDHQ